MKKSLGLIILLCLSLVISANPSIWLTLDSCNTINNSVSDLNYVNRVFLNGAGFGANNSFRLWKIEGMDDSCTPGIIKMGNFSFDGNGNGCVEALTIANECGDYRFYIGSRYVEKYVNKYEPPTIPEFKLFFIPLILLVSLAVYFSMRK